MSSGNIAYVVLQGGMRSARLGTSGVTFMAATFTVLYIIRYDLDD